MRVGAFQAPLEACESIDTSLALIRARVQQCEAEGIEILCCPEAVLGGLADDAADPEAMAISVDDGRLQRMLEPLASARVATIVGFTEIDGRRRVFNAAAVCFRGEVLGVYRKHHPARRRSIYSPGVEVPLFAHRDLVFGVVICRDSTFADPARTMASRGAAVLFVPTNNGLAPTAAGPEIVAEARACDVALALAHRVAIVRADVAGRTAGRVSYGSSAIVAADGRTVASAARLGPDLIVADIDVAARDVVLSS